MKASALIAAALLLGGCHTTAKLDRKLAAELISHSQPKSNRFVFSLCPLLRPVTPGIPQLL
jgi:hypothetical protein